MTPGKAPSRESSSAPDEIHFEDALDQLESVVDQLERGDLALEDALGAFERGVRLSVQCAAQLDAAEKRIETLIREGGEWVTRPFEREEEPPDDEAGG